MGALTIKKYAFQFRPWELESQIIKNIFSFFPENIVLYYKNKQLIRILPEFNNQFISNRIRFLKVKQKSNLNYFNLYFLGYSLLSKFKFFKILTGFKLHFFYIHGFDYKQNFLVFNSIFENFEKNLQIFNKNTDFSFLEGTAVFIGQFLSLVSLVFNKLIDRKTFLFGKLKQNYAVLFKKSSLYLECFFFFSHEVVYINNDNIQNQNAALY